MLILRWDREGGWSRAAAISAPSAMKEIPVTKNAQGIVEFLSASN